MADDAVNRGLTVEQANPFLDVETLKYLGDEVNLKLWDSFAFFVRALRPSRTGLRRERLGSLRCERAISVFNVRQIARKKWALVREECTRSPVRYTWVLTTSYLRLTRRRIERS